MKKRLAVILLLSICLVACGPAKHVHTITVKNGEVISENAIRCPKCNGDNLSTNNRGYSLGKGITGGVLLGPVGLLLGTSGSWKTVFTCMSCGYTWMPQIQKVEAGKDANKVIIEGQRFQDGIYK